MFGLSIPLPPSTFFYLHAMKITYFGHSCFLFERGADSLLCDPFIRANALASSVDVSSIRPNKILISHGHGDHIADAREIALQSDATVYSAYEIANWLGEQQVKTVGMNAGGRYRGDALQFSFTQAVHSSSLPDGTYCGSAMGAMLSLGNQTAYFAGDTDIFGDMELLAEVYKPDFALLPIGDTFTMGAQLAARAASMMNLKTVIGMHYDTFPPITISHDEARKAFRDQGIDLILLKVGESIQF